LAIEHKNFSEWRSLGWLPSVSEREVLVAERRSSSQTVFFAASTSSFRQAECGVIVEALRAASGRIAGKGGGAERLGLKRTTLQNKIRRLGSTKAHYQN
jgi:transcriptional regulator with GAF, ATPase, and Fis domain